MHRHFAPALAPAMLAALMALTGTQAQAQVGTAFDYTENFDSLAATGTTGTALPAGWAMVETGTSANTSYGVGTGSSNTGNSYSFGASNSTDRALGSLQSGSVVATFGVQLVNLSLGMDTLVGLNISYTGEQWRLGNTGRSDRLDFQYSLDATSLQTGAWTDVDALDFSSVVTTGTVGALNGNAQSLLINGSISGLNVAPGGQVWLRWQDFNATGADDGLAIDNLRVSSVVAAVPEPETWALVLAGAGVAAMARRRKG
jgi:hypothetical protein